MKIGIICAGDREFAPFIPCIKECKITEKSMLKFYEGKIANVDVVELFFGVCKVNAAVATQILIDTFRVDAIINAGAAGGMDERLNLFDVAVSTEVAYHDVAPHILTEFHPWMDSIYFQADAYLLALVKSAVSKLGIENTVFYGRMVTGDELMGYDEAKAKSDVDKILAEYQQFGVDGRFDERKKLTVDARKKYPHDYRIMNAYMWDKAGGNAGKDAKTLLKNKDELTQICDCILEGCNQDNIRVEAINMKAKLLHAAGDTDGALEILSRLPTRYASIVKEQLFAKDTEEYRYWNKWNCYGSMDIMGINLARIIRFDQSLSVSKKIQRLEPMAEAFAEMSEKKTLNFSVLANKQFMRFLQGCSPQIIRQSKM